MLFAWIPCWAKSQPLVRVVVIALTMAIAVHVDLPAVLCPQPAKHSLGRRASASLHLDGRNENLPIYAAACRLVRPDLTIGRQGQFDAAVAGWPGKHGQGGRGMLGGEIPGKMVDERGIDPATAEAPG
jgi:hypothetical protein